MDALTDTSPMPFGKYGPAPGEGRTMANVPDWYLISLYDKMRGTRQFGNGKLVREYIEDNAAALGIQIKKQD